MSYTRVLGPDGNPRADVVSRDSDGIYVATSTICPFWMTADAQAYQDWLAAGNTPSPAPAGPAATVTGNQWAFALSTLGLSAAWRIGVTKSKDSDQVRVDLISRSTPLLVSDPLLIRVAANAGADANGNPLISVPAVFATAQGMPL